MVQSLLSDRFKMRFHRATTETDGYALSVGSGGIKAKSANGADEPSARPADSHIFATVPEPGVVAITGHNSSIAKLAETLQRSLKVPIWDRTGLAGSYDFAFRYTQDPAAEFHADAPSLATALRDSLGFTLMKAKGPLETLVIDNIEQPTEN